MFKLSFALLVAVASAAPTGGKQHHLKHDKSVQQQAVQQKSFMSESPCPTANEATCSGNGLCYKGGEEANGACTSMADVGGDTNVCMCECDPGWKGWDCFTVDSCTDDMPVSMDFDGVYYDFYKANMNTQVKFKLSETDSCDMPGSPGASVPTFTKGESDGYIYQPFKVVGKYATSGAQTPWSEYGACGTLIRKVGSVQDGDVSIYFYNRKSQKAFKGDIEAHRMKVFGSTCKVFSWRIKENAKAKKGWAWGEKAQAVWETNGKPEEF